MKHHLICLAVITFGPFAAADLKYVKEGRPSITLTFIEDSNTASIVDNTRKGPMIEGNTVLDDKGNFIIQRQDGEGCPDARVRLNKDLFKGDHASADVSMITAGAAARTADCEITDIEGHYVRAE